MKFKHGTRRRATEYRINPFLWCHSESIKSCLISKRVELHTVKIFVIQDFPQSNKF